jgi:putative transposase
MEPPLGDVRAKTNKPSAEAKEAKEFLKLASDRELAVTGPDGLLKQSTKNVHETALVEEMTERLGHEKNRALGGRESANVRNGSRPKTVLTAATGPVQIEVPRDRDGSGLFRNAA